MKRILTILCSLIMCFTLFAGCNLIELNKGKYYQTVVVEVTGNEKYNKEYTREDVLNAFYNYSYSNVSNGSVTAEEGLETAIDSMVERGLLVDFIKANYFDTGVLTFSEKDEDDVRYEAFKYMQEQIYTYENTVREEWDMVLTHEHSDEETTEEESSSLRAEYTPYTSNIEAVYDNDGNVVKFINRDNANKNTNLVVPEEFEDFIQITDEDVSSEAYARYVSSLQKTAKSQGKSTKEDDVIEAEVDRLTKILTENKYITLYQEWFDKNQQFIADEDNESVYTLKESVMYQVLEEYKKTYDSQKKLFDLSESAYHAAMAEDSSAVYYHPTYGDGAEYMYVSHILIKFSDAQVTKVENLKKELENGVITQAYYDLKMQEIINKTPVTYEENGVTKSSNAAKVYDYVLNYVNSNASDDDYEKRASLFNEMIYMFNDDEGIMNKDFAYVVNLDTNVQDQMVAEFANASRELNSNPEKGIGSISEMVVSEYGIHIIFHAGIVSSANPEGLNTQQLLNSLVNHKTQLSSDKTLFDMVYDNITSASADVRTQNMVNQAKGYVTITTYPKKYKSLLEV